jgi:Tol biopolymer transport system component/tRNA A-37 threonylcarbamoyl transferase component Bud32
MPLAVASTLGPYEILSLIGSGAMGEVYRARDTRLGREVALKVIRGDAMDNPARRQRFELEARAVSRLNHPNVLTIHDVGHDDGNSWIVSELVEGESLRAIIRRGALPLRRLLELGIQIAEGLAAAHAAGIVHRDLKPDNIMVTRDSRVKILDFGLAKPILKTPEGEENVTLGNEVTAPGVLLGTAAYVSPEQARGEEVSFYSDQFSFGVILYEMATGERPFRGNTPLETLSNILREPAPEVTVGPVPFRWLIMRCLHKEPDHRYRSTADIVRDLTVVRDHLTQTQTSDPITIAPAALPEQANRFSSRSVLLGLLFLAAAAGGFLLARVLAPAEGVDLDRQAFLPYASTDALEVFPAWAPNGRTLAWSSEIDGTFQIFVRSTSSHAATQLTRAPDDCLHAFWSPDGARVYYISEAHGQPSLWSVSATGGTPELVLQDVVRAAVAPDDGRTFAFLRSDGHLWLGELGRELKRYDRGPFRSAAFLPASYLRFSPHGKSLAAWLSRPDAQSEFWIIPLDAGEPRRAFSDLPSPLAREFDWFRDSRRIVFGRGTGFSMGAHLWIGDTRAGTLSALTAGTGNELSPSVAPDGRTVAFSASALDYDLVSVPLAGGDLLPLDSSSAFELSPAVAANGELAFVTDRRGLPEIWIGDRPVIGEKDFGEGSTVLLSDIAFSPGGERFAFRRTAAGQDAIWIATTAGDPPVRLARNTGEASQQGPTWSPDGNWIAYYTIRDGRGVLKRARVGGFEPPQVIRTDAGTSPRWSPRNDWIATLAPGEGLLLTSPDGTRHRQVASGRWLVHGWSSDGRLIYGLRIDGERRLASVSVDAAAGHETVLRDLGPQPASFTWAFATGTQPAHGFGMSADGRSFVTSLLRLHSDVWLLTKKERDGRLTHLLSQ